MPINRNNIEHLKGLDLFATQAVEGFITGMHKSPFHGFSVEFSEHRQYNTGESTKHLDWKLFAKTDKLYVKRYEEETNLRCSILIDTSSSMYFGGDNHSTKINFSTHAAAALMNLLKKQRDAFNLTTFNEDITFSSDIKSNTKHYHYLLSHLDQLENETNVQKKSALAKVLHQISETAHRRSLIIVFSDMFENTENEDEMLKALQHLKHNKHEVVLFHVMDKNLEINLNFENRPYVFIDKETGEEVKLNPQQIRDEYIINSKSQAKQIKDKCAQYQIDYVEADIKNGYNDILQKYLVKRRKIIR